MHAATAKKKHVKKAAKKTATKSIPFRAELLLPLEPAPLLREALICATDDKKRWGSKGTVAHKMGYGSDLHQMNVLAEKAADLTRGTRCFWCGVEQPATARDDVYRFAGKALCECHTPFRNMAFDYLENWETEEGKKSLLAQTESGKISLSEPVYQYFCRCGRGPCIVDVRAITVGLRKHQKHSRRRLCNTCYQAQNAVFQKRLKAQKPELTAAKPKDGPAAKINKIKAAKHLKGPKAKSLPPLSALKEKAPEASA